MRFEKSGIFGGEELSAYLADFPARIQKDIVDKATKSAIDDVFKKLIKQNIETMFQKKSGNLLKGVKTDKLKGLGNFISAYRVYMGAPAYHSHFFEYGTVKYRPAMGPKTDRGKKRYTKYSRPVLIRMSAHGDDWVTIKHTGGITAKPFFRPAIDEGSNYIKKAYGFEMAEQMKKLALKMTQEYGTLSKTMKRKLAS